MISNRISYRCAKRPTAHLRLALLALVFLSLTGCANQQYLRDAPLGSAPGAMTDSGYGHASLRDHDPGLVFYSDEMLLLLAENDGADSINQPTWLDQRNDRWVGLKPIAWDPFTSSSVIVTQDDYSRNTNGRPRHYNTRRIRSVRSRRGR